MKSLKINKATLADGIDITFVKIANSIIVPAISEIFQLCVFRNAAKVA